MIKTRRMILADDVTHMRISFRIQSQKLRGGHNIGFTSVDTGITANGS
jgi:hypothetical protein